MHYEQRKLKDWYENQKANGMLYVHYSFADGVLDKLNSGELSREELCADINKVNECKNSRPLHFNDSKRLK